MAWRIEEHVVRGEFDNRVRGRVAEKIWFVGHAEPVELELTGNCWRDLAGRRLEFVNPAPKPGPEGNLATRQVGWQERADAEGWVSDDAMAEHPVQELLDALMKVHVKLAAWLNSREWPPSWRSAPWRSCA